MIDMLRTGASSVMAPEVFLLICSGVIVGIIFGVIPGFTAAMGVALLLPITIGMNPIPAMAFLLALYIGGISGGLISAILINRAGTPSSIATCFDGHPMAARGEAGKALGLGIIFSFLGGLFGLLVLLFLAPPLAKWAVTFRTLGYFGLVIFSLILIASLSKDSLVKGLISCLIGVVISLFGISPIDGNLRYTFGIEDMITGFNLLPVLIGFFAVTKIFEEAEGISNVKKEEIAPFSLKGFGFSLKEFTSQKWNFIRSSVIGVVIGILPGIGGGTSNIASYTVAKNQSKTPEKFGTGIIDGVVAPETAGHATIGGALVPMFTLGIPGDTVTAILLGAFMIHNITPGLVLFTTQSDLFYVLFAALFIANILALVIRFFGLKMFANIVRVPKHYLLPIMIALCFVGVFGINNRAFDIWPLVLCGVLGYGMEKFNFPLAPVIIGVILGPIAEINLRRGLMITQGNFLPFLTHPICALFLVLSVVTAVLSVRAHVKNAGKNKVSRDGSFTITPH